MLVAGAPRSDETIVLEWGRRRDAAVETVGNAALSTKTWPDLFIDQAPWHLITAHELPRRDPSANVVRIALASTSLPSSAVAVTAPVTYTTKLLAQELRPASTQTLLMSPTVTYFPCVQLPRMHDGIVDVPDHLVTLRDAAATPVAYATSPFVGLLDLYTFERLPWADTANPPSDVTAFRIERRIRGARLVSAQEATIAS
jgi:hypothetical protein